MKCDTQTDTHVSGRLSASHLWQQDTTCAAVQLPPAPSLMAAVWWLHVHLLFYHETCSVNNVSQLSCWPHVRTWGRPLREAPVVKEIPACDAFVESVFWSREITSFCFRSHDRVRLRVSNLLESGSNVHLLIQSSVWWLILMQLCSVLLGWSGTRRWWILVSAEDGRQDKHGCGERLGTVTPPTWTWSQSNHDGLTPFEAQQ